MLESKERQAAKHDTPSDMQATKYLLKYQIEQCPPSCH